MVISLLGIIVLQTKWVSSAVAEREKEFDNRVNNALNEVSNLIGEDEATVFIREEFGGMDSLMQNFLVIKDEIHSESDSIEFETHQSQRIQISIDNNGCKLSSMYCCTLALMLLPPFPAKPHNAIIIEQDA